MFRLFFKNLLALFFHICFFLLKPFISEKGLVVLNYHSVSSNEWIYSVDPRMFERQIKYLVQYRNVVSASDIAAYVRDKKNLPKHSVALTFDDGYADFLTNALPILKKYNVPATVFIISPSSSRPKDLGNNFPLLKPEEIKEISEAGIEIGSHGKTHSSLDRISLDEAEKELIESKKELEAIIGKQVRYFSYPKGKFNRDVIDLVRRSDYEAAFSIKQGLVRPGDDIFSIKRVVVDRNQNMSVFKIRLTKMVEWWTSFWRFYNRLFKLCSKKF